MNWPLVIIPIALGLSFLAGSLELFLSALFTGSFLIYRRLHEWSALRDEREKIERQLFRSGFKNRGNNLEEQVRRAIWQAHSVDELGVSLSELRTVLSDELNCIREDGSSALQEILPVLSTQLRTGQVALIVSEDDVQRVICSHELNSQKESDVLQITGHLISTHEPFQPEVFDTDHRQSHLFSFWDNCQHLLFVTDSGEGSSLSFLVGYPGSLLPLPREQAIVNLTLQLCSRALRENAARRQVIEDAEREKKQQEKYFAHVSHDIRTPLNNIQAILDLFYLEGVTQENQQFLQVARSNCRSLRDIVEELLEFTKYKDGVIQLREEEFSLREVIQDVINDFRLTADLKGISLRHQIESSIGVRGDRKHIKRVLLNLVSNGIKYTQEGEVVVHLHERNDKLLISVSDTGIGIPNEKLEHLFVPFSRVGEVSVEGIGLGLTLTKMLVEANHGQIEIDSEHGKGSRFTVSFPGVELKRSPENIREAEESASLIPEQGEVPRSSQKLRLLIVDDDRAAAESLGRLLERFSFEVQTVTRLSELKELMNFWKPDLVVSDVEIPGGGIEKVLSCAHLLQIPVIAVTGCVDSEKLSEVSRQGVFQIIRKPVDPGVLVTAIEAAVVQPKNRAVG